MNKLTETKKKPYASKTYTTGDIAFNIKQFNKRMRNSNDNNNPSTEEAKARAAAESAAKSVGTISAQSPDGGSSISCGASSANGEGGGMGESLELKESKRYVRRYYMKPQNIFCSNKTDVLNALIDHEDQDCKIYTLINREDRDVSKLTDKDVIYYYEDGILYDKNHLKIMDYDLFIKHEEERPKIDIAHTPDSKLADVYHDRLTGLSHEEDDVLEAFDLDFPDVNAYGEKLHEGKTKEATCCICGEKIDGYGNNAEPYKTGKCCSSCNSKFVIPARLAQAQDEEN